MNRKYTASSEHWADIESWVAASSKASTDHCILELLYRVEALEAANYARAIDRLHLTPTETGLLAKQALEALHAIATGSDDLREYSQDIVTIESALRRLAELEVGND
jgi:hypothetical protein